MLIVKVRVMRERAIFMSWLQERTSAASSSFASSNVMPDDCFVEGVHVCVGVYVCWGAGGEDLNSVS